MSTTPPSSQDIAIYPLNGFRASTWRENCNPVPDYATYGPGSANYPSVTFYTGLPYNPDPTASLNDVSPGTSINMSLLDSGLDASGHPTYLGEVFWQVFFQEIFPSVNENDFLKEMSTGTPGGYFIQLYNAALCDFYDSYFQGRDFTNSADPNFGTVAPTSTNWWTQLSNDDQSLIIKKYLMTRDVVSDQYYFDINGNLIDRAYQGNLLLNNLNLRTLNIFHYIAYLMVQVMEELQTNTIDAAQYATRLAETQQTISNEMGKTSYFYKTLTTPDDFPTQATNQNNGQLLENMRTVRDMLQKQTDQASTFLETSQQAVEDLSGKALDFLKRGNDVIKLFFQAM